MKKKTLFFLVVLGIVTCTFLLSCVNSKDEHIYGDFIPAIEATCESDGVIGHYHCSHCDSYFDSEYNNLETIVVVKKDHNYGQLHSKTDATCLKTGNISYYQCSDCHKYFDESKNLIDSIELAKLNHNPAEAVVENVVEATCSTQGSYDLVVRCSMCEFELSSEHFTSDKLEHNYGEWIAEVPSTCVVEGTAAHYHCENCGLDFDEEKNVLKSLALQTTEHAYVYHEYKAPTCGVEGNVEYTSCENCDNLFKPSEMIFPANSGYSLDDIYGNWGLSDVVVKYYDAEHSMVAHIERIDMSDANSRFYKYITPTLVAGQTYVLEFDILISENYNGNFYVQVVNWPTFQDAYGFNGVQAVMSSTEWTHIRQEFTLSSDFTASPNELAFWMWEGSQGDYVLIDNIKLTTVNGTSVDTLGDGKFDSFLEYTPFEGNVILDKLTHNYEEVIDKEATIYEAGEKHLECTNCHDKKDYQTIPQLVCTHPDLQHIEYKAATCVEDGVEEHYYCENCGSYFLLLSGTEYTYVEDASTLVIKSEGHSYVYNAYKAPTCEENGNIVHISCENCDELFKTSEFTFTANSGFEQDDVYGNWGQSDVVIKYYDAEYGMVAYIERINMSDANSRFYKQINSTMVAGQTYVVEFDILISANYNGNFYVQVVSWPTQQDAYGFNGVQSVMSSTEWTHIRQEFTLSNDFTTGPNELVFWMWEGSQGDYVLIDNIKLTTVDGTCVDTLGDGKFDSFLEYTPFEGNIVLDKLTHNYEEVIDKAATIYETGEKHLECTKCHDKKDYQTIPQLECTHPDLQHIEYKAATCEEDGVEDHYYCENCESYFKLVDEDYVLVADASTLVIKSKGHVYVYHAYQAPTSTENGNIEYFSCENCDELFIVSEMTFTANSGFAQDDIYGNWGQSDVVVKYHDAEHGMVAHIERINMSDTNSRFYKQINSTMVAGQTYVVEFDILISANYNGNFYVQVVSWPTQQDAYGHNGVQSIMSSTEWTHIRQEFTLSNDFTTGPNELVFWMWEGGQGDYVLIDNIKLTTVDGTSVDTLGDGKFDSLLEYTPFEGNVVLTPCEHSYVYHAYQAPTSTENGNIEYFSCENCDELFTVSEMTFTANSGYAQDDVYGNWGPSDVVVQYNDEEHGMVANIERINMSESNSRFYKLINSTMIAGQTYVLEFDILISANYNGNFFVQVVNYPTSQDAYGLIGVQTVMSSTEWTHIRQEFTLSGDFTASPNELVFWMWEGSQGDYVLIDNIKLTTLDGTSVDTLGDGGFDSFFQYTPYNGEVILPKQN